MKLQLFLSHNGVASRRKAMVMIQAGEVLVNQKKCVEPSEEIDPMKDKIEVNGRVIKAKPYEYIIFNKPMGYVTTKSGQFRQETIYDILPKKFQYLFPVGRLDRDTEGLLILTNDGEFANQLSHPSFNVGKTYFVRMTGKLVKEKVKKLEEGVMIEDQCTAPAKVKNIKDVGIHTEFMLTIHEGRKRQVRLMIDQIGEKVVYLKRVRQGPYQLGPLPTGKWRELKKV